MADVAKTGSTYVHTHGGSGNNDLAATVPTDADMAVFIATCYVSGGTSIDIANWDADTDLEFTRIETANGSNNQSIDSFYMLSSSGAWPGTGAKTLRYSWLNAPESGGASVAIVFFLTNVNLAAPIIGSEESAGSQNWTSPSLGAVGAEDLAIIAGGDYTSAPTVNGNSQDILYAGNDTTAYLGVGSKLNEDQPVISSAGGYLEAIAFAVKAAAGGGIELPSVDISSASSVGDVVLNRTRLLEISDIVSLSACDTDTMSRIRTIATGDISSASSIGSEVIARIRTLALGDVASSSSVSNPAVAPAAVATLLTMQDVASSTSVGGETLSRIRSLTIGDISSDSSITEEILTRLRQLGLQDVTADTLVTDVSLSLFGAVTTYYFGVSNP